MKPVQLSEQSYDWNCTCPASARTLSGTYTIAFALPAFNTSLPGKELDQRLPVEFKEPHKVPSIGYASLRSLYDPFSRRTRGESMSTVSSPQMSKAGLLHPRRFLKAFIRNWEVFLGDERSLTWQ
jgi:hypothetical protein